MARPFDLRKEIEPATTPEQAWHADQHPPQTGWMTGRPGAHTRNIKMGRLGPGQASGSRVAQAGGQRRAQAASKLPASCLDVTHRSPQMFCERRAADQASFIRTTGACNA